MRTHRWGPYKEGDQTQHSLLLRRVVILARGLALALYALTVCQSAVAAPQVASRATDSLDDWFASETTVSLNGTFWLTLEPTVPMQKVPPRA
ncbi:hypothetical protein PENNAL_c0232G00178 [Penicillium nalgiovense]|uniref:Uncharacterized protein n=1 Tax=Penicillium nalgiovense TaxID=60175 RepID=A0A1V6WEC5_PENNA|nr:hypothetical protein PENNAL_c0290G11560 [Penicillium nalgiovense]OQE63989.1 hypothetical protein PENNAL_c0232G00178 [Penicillium nalgiovense]